MTEGDARGWVVLLPLKAVSDAKSRLRPAFAHREDLEQLVQAMRHDVLTALRATPDVVAVVGAVDRHPTAAGLGLGDHVVVQQSPGLNAALAAADVYAAGQFPGAGRVAVVGDLPALTPHDLGRVLAAAAGHRRAFVADLAGTGTTMLAVTDGPLEPAFGPGSAVRHGRDAALLAAPPGARFDVDEPADLQPTVAGGFGPATRAALARVPAGPPAPCPGT